MQDQAAEVGNISSVALKGTEDVENFIYLISHDLRGSVRALLELPQWIAEDLKEAGVDLDARLSGSFELMNRHTRRLDRMIVDLLTYSRIGRMQEVNEVDLDDTIDHALAALRLPDSFKVSRVVDVPRIVIGERDILTLLCALLENAVKHHDAAAGRISLSIRDQGADVVISVLDDGPGIEPAFHERIFAPMITLRPRDEVEGSGMGLANVRKIARLYGGDARLYTAPSFPKGCEVIVTLPKAGAGYSVI